MRTKLIACATVAEAVRGLGSPGLSCQTLPFGLHLTPERLNAELQQAIDRTDESVDTILLGYGLCSRGAVGLAARRFRLVIPRVDDCIALFLGSRERYAEQLVRAPGTFYLTRGWIECGDDPYTEYLKLCERYGAAKAYRLEKLVIAHYTRVALIETGGSDVERYQGYARKMAAFFGLDYEEIRGSTELAAKLVHGDWDARFAVVEPGGQVGDDLLG